MGRAEATIAIACATDARYALPLAVMLNSVGTHVRPGVHIDAYVLDDGVSPEDQRKVEASVPENIRLRWRQANSAIDGLPTWGRMSPTTYQRLTIEEWVPPEVERAVWLDCDLLVTGDLAMLWNAPMGEFAAMAVQDQRVPLVSSRFGVVGWRELGLPRGAKYFNAGVVMMDLARWRARNTGRRCLEYLRQHRDTVYFWDQEAMNAVLAGQWGELDPRWNWNPALEHVSAKLRGRKAHPDYAILHFNGNLKPWKFSGGGRYHALYREYLERTAWAGERLAESRKNRILAWYETSRLRRLSYPAEQLATIAVRALTRNYSQ